MPAPESPDLLAFFQTIFPEEIYAFGAPAPAGPAARGEEPSPEPAAAPLPPPAVKAEAPAPALVTPQPSRPPLPLAAEAPVAPPVSSSTASPEPVSASLPPAFTPGTTHQQSRGSGTGAVIVQRIPAADFAKLNQSEFWQNFLKFLGYDWPTVRLVNVLTNDPLPLPELLASAPGASRLLLFGSGLVAPLPPEAPAYDRYQLPAGGPELLRVHAAAELTPERKRLLLAAVQSWKG